MAIHSPSFFKRYLPVIPDLLLLLPAGPALAGPNFNVRVPRGFREIKRDKLNKLPQPTADETRRCYLLFTRADPGDIYPTSVPAREEIV